MDTNPEQLNEMEPKTYEIGYLLSPFIPEESVEEMVGSILKAAIEAAGGKVTTSPVPRMRALAYPVAITKGGKRTAFTDAYFGALRLEVAPGAVESIKQSLDKSAEILRYLITIVPKNAGAMTIKMSGQTKPVAPVEEAPKEEKVEEKPEMSAAEIDKEIDELLTTNL